MGRRLWEVDFTRGVALVLMLVFNWSFALRFLDVWAIAEAGNWLYWWVFPRFIAFMFIFIVGVSLTLSVNRLRRQHPDEWRHIRWRKYSRRGAWIFALGLGITGVTYLFYPERFIYFGILHLIGASIVLAIPLLTHAWVALAAGMGVIAAAVWVGAIQTQSRLLAVLGFHPSAPTFDYFPLIPWFGVVLLGLWTGHVCFPDGQRRVRLPDLDELPLRGLPVAPVTFVGRHTLLIYLVHQPALVGLLLLAGVDVF